MTINIFFPNVRKTCLLNNYFNIISFEFFTKNKIPWQQTGSGEREIPYSDKLGVLRVSSLPRASQQRNLPSRQENFQLPGDDVEARS